MTMKKLLVIGFLFACGRSELAPVADTNESGVDTPDTNDSATCDLTKALHCIETAKTNNESTIVLGEFNVANSCQYDFPSHDDFALYVIAHAARGVQWSFTCPNTAATVSLSPAQTIAWQWCTGTCAGSESPSDANTVDATAETTSTCPQQQYACLVATADGSPGVLGAASAAQAVSCPAIDRPLVGVDFMQFVFGNRANAGGAWSIPCQQAPQSTWTIPADQARVWQRCQDLC